MTNRMKLLAAAAAIALPAAMAGAQSTAPGGGNHRPTAHSQAPATQTPPTANTATEDAQPATTPPPDTPAAVNNNAEPGTQGDVTSQAAPPAQTPPAAQPAPATAQAATPATPPANAAVRAATAADLHAGAQVHDQAGGVVGTVESADASSAVVSTGTLRARLPLTSFAANSQGGLVIAMTRTQLEAAATQPRPAAS